MGQELNLFKVTYQPKGSSYPLNRLEVKKKAKQTYQRKKKTKAFYIKGKRSEEM